MGRFRAVSFFSGLLLTLFASTSAVDGGEACEPGWAPMFGPAAGLDLGFSVGTVFDDGSGPALYVAGPFRVAAGIDVNGIARWDGESWSAVGSGFDSPFDVIHAMVVYNDGAGDALYVAGSFTSIGGEAAQNIAKWNGVAWSNVGQGLTGGIATRVLALEVFDDGSGPALYAGGSFTLADGLPAPHIARWDGATWSDVGGGVDTLGATVEALEVFDAGDGPSLIIGGAFDRVSGVPALGIASWNGVAWSALGLGVGTGGTVRAMLVQHEVDGDRLYVGGNFRAAGGMAAENIAIWDGAAWSSGGSGLTNARQLIEFQDDLYARDGTALRRLVKEQWIPDATLTNVFLRGLATFADALYVGSGTNIATDSLIARGIAKWDGVTLSPVGDGLSLGVNALTFFDEGEGPRLFVAGGAPFIDGMTVRISRWDGTSLSRIGEGFTGSASVMTVWNDGKEASLYIGGSRFEIDGVESFGVVRWDGETWTDVGGGIDPAGGIPTVRSFDQFDDDGDGTSSLYVGGRFLSVSGIAVNSIAEWNGVEWTPVGAGLRIENPPVGPSTQGLVTDMATYDDGAGRALFVCGLFDTAGDQAAPGIARWDGKQWTRAGDTAGIRTIEVYDDGSGESLYGAAGANVLVWNGKNWATVGVLGGAGVVGVSAMTVFDDGSGPALYIGGEFSSVNGDAANGIARWDGQSWTAVDVTDRQDPGRVLAFASLSGAAGSLSGLFVGGDFERLVPTRDDFLARLAGCALEACPGDATGDRVVDMKDINAALSTFGQTGEPGSIPADVDGDGTVDFQDLNTILSNFGQTCE